MCKVFEISPSAASKLEVDPLAKLTMTYTAEGLEELRKDIVDNGQLVPIILRSGKILDGRHRHDVCDSLGIGIMCKEVGDISDTDALTIVISNAINKSTNTDASKTEAYLLCKAKGISKSDMPKTFSRLNINYVRKLSFIEKENPEYLNVLLHQNSVRLYNAEFKKVEDYGTINGLWKTLKGNKKFSEQVVEVVPEPVSSKEYMTDLESYFDNAAAESEYWEIFNVAKDSGYSIHPDSALGKKIAGLIKSKYRS
tara:strand:+ start:1279 stop:2040 length:762 start_codon:yes stop_codon:yes gene_type:complete